MVGNETRYKGVGIGVGIGEGEGRGIDAGDRDTYTLA
jgi:hypothetical protein